MDLNWRHGGEIGECMGWIFGLQFCFDGWLFLLDGCGFASLFFFFLLCVSSATGECLAEILFLQWLVVFVVVGCDFGGWLWLYFVFFSFSFLPAGGCGCHSGAVTCGGGSYGGLWLLQWWLWQVERW